MVKKVLVPLLVGVLSLYLFSACGGASRKVTRIASDETIDISGRWNDTDSRLTAQAMIKDVLSRPWLSDFQMKNGKKPTVIVGTIRNKSSEHIPVDVFVKDIERELINSGEVEFVASRSEREEVRDERVDQQKHASVETAKELGQEKGADYMLKGTINSIVDSFEGQRVVYYQVDLELIDLENNTKVWIGNKKIKKFIEQDSYKW
ncbi:MAG TPA: penicillin-binding protein activator LpoB [Calditrichaeota bacterium]|nr:penicillin-binding protein activator LpoB [Calditrichota bacterium]